jgi:hypothetical protein
MIMGIIFSDYSVEEGREGGKKRGKKGGGDRKGKKGRKD